MPKVISGVCHHRHDALRRCGRRRDDLHRLDDHHRLPGEDGRVAEGVGSIAIPIEGDNIISDSCLIISDNIERMSPKDTRKIYETVRTYLSSNAHRNIRLRRFPQRS